MAEILLLCVIASGAWAVGRPALRKLVGEHDFPGAFSFSLALGLGVLSLLTLGIGIMGILYRWVLFVMIGCTFLLVPLTLTLPSPARRRGNRHTGKMQWLLYAVILGILIMEVFCALGPPVEYDALSYHLLRPKYFLERHRIDFSTSNAFFQFPLLMECLYTLGMGLISDRLAQLTHFLTMLIALVALYEYGKKKGGEALALLSGLFFLCIPMVNYNAPTGLVDVGLASYEILSFLAILSWTESGGRGNNSWLLLAGAMTGFALGIKYTGLIALLLNIAVILCRRFSGKNALLKPLALYLLPVIVLPSFWYIKNLVTFSNPLHPFFPQVFALMGLAPAAVPGYADMQMYHYSFGAGRSLRTLLILPWIVTMPHYRIPLESGAMPVIPLAVLPGLLLLRQVPGWVKGVLAWCGAYLILWFFFGTQQGRFIITPMALLSLPTAFSVLGLLKREKAVRWTTLMVIVLGVGACLGVLAYKRGSKALAGAGAIPSATYLEKAIGPYATYQYIRSRLPQAKVFLFFDTRMEYYLGAQHLACESENPHPLCREDASRLSSEELTHWLATLGISHILVNEDDMAFYKGSRWETPAMKRTYTLVGNLCRLSRRVFSANGTSLYEVLIRR